MKKIISVFLSIVMMLSVISGINFTSYAAEGIYNRPALSEASAMDFLQFLYNEKLDESKIRSSKYFPLLTGKFAGTDEEYEAESIAFSIFVRTRINELVDNSEYNLSSSYNYLYNYLSKKLESSKDLPQEIIEEYKGKAMKIVEEGILDLLINGVADTTGIIVTEEHISWVKLVGQETNVLPDLAGQVAKYIEYVSAAIQGCRFVLAKEAQQRYWYFSSYLNNRAGFNSPTDEIFKALDDGNFTICATNSTGSLLIDLLSWITGKNSWVNHRETIQEWAEFVYQIENLAIKNVNVIIKPTEYNGHTYQVFDISMNWTDAEEYCEFLGGHLVTINSEEEQNLLINLVKFSTKKNMWIGARLSDKNYVWITGEPFSYSNWAPDEPNNVFNMQNAAMMYTQNASYPAGTWNDENENGRDWTGYHLSDFGFICEWDNTYSNIIVNNHEDSSHNHVFKTEIVESTCIKNGYTKYSCEICYYFYTDNYTSSLGHDYQYSRIVNPTCTEKGYDLYTCERCGNGEKTKLVDALGHNYNFTKTVAPTCTAQGYDLYTCSRCNITEKRNTVVANGHTYSFTKTVEPTCTAQGYDLYTCVVCRATEKRNAVSAKGHSYVFSSHKDPTCNTEGYDEYICTVCSTTKKDTIAVLDGSALTASLEKAQKYLAKGYFTEESIAILQSVYDSHSNDLGILTTQEAVDEAVTEIETAISELVLGDYASGETDGGFRWCWEKGTGTLTVSGSGKMSNYTATTMPWYDVLPYTTEIVVSEGVTSIGNYAFYKAEKVKHILLSNTLEIIDKSAFEHCSSVEELIVPDGVQQLGYGTFASMTSLRKVTVPASTTYRSYCFDKDTAIEEIIITYGIDGVIPAATVTAEQSSILDLLLKKTGAFGPWRYAQNATVKIEDGVKNIGDKIFYQSTGITRFDIPDSVTSIGEQSFYNCASLTNITISDSVKDIGNNAFADCYSLTIYGYIDSCAETHANENSIPFIALGDADFDGIIDANDYAMIRSYVMYAQNLTEEQLVISDYNRDGVVDAFDAIALDVYINTRP